MSRQYLKLSSHHLIVVIHFIFPLLGWKINHWDCFLCCILPHPCKCVFYPRQIKNTLHYHMDLAPFLLPLHLYSSKQSKQHLSFLVFMTWGYDRCPTLFYLHFVGMKDSNSKWCKLELKIGQESLYFRKENFLKLFNITGANTGVFVPLSLCLFAFLSAYGNTAA